MSDIAYLRARAEELRAVAETARDPGTAMALRDVAAEFEHEARVAAVEHAMRHDPARQYASAA